MISLNVQWVPVNDRSGTYQWNGTDTSSQKVKTVTFFGTGEMRGQKQAKPITPPSSDYTDAYLSAFSSKSIPTRHVNRISTSVFATAAPVPLKPPSPTSLTSKPMKTSETRFTTTTNIPTSTSPDKPAPSLSSRSSTYASSFTSERSTPYEPFSATQYEPFSTTQYSSPQSQTFTSSYSTLLRTPTSTITKPSSPSVESQRSYTTVQSRSQPSLPLLPSLTRYETSYSNLYRPLPAYSLQSYPPSNTYTTSLSSSSSESTYKPSVPFQSAPLSPTYNINQTSFKEPIIRPTPKYEKPFDRPETLLFKSDEGIQSSRIEKRTEVLSPSIPSISTTTNREELKIEPERLHMEEVPEYSSEPIRILESTLNKYDSLINQISEVLASVSPLSSTLSSMSPGKSVLDYTLSSDSSPVAPIKEIGSELSQQSTTTTTETITTEETQPSYLIRKGSYEKITSAMSDIEKEITTTADAQLLTSTVSEEKVEEKSPETDELQAQPPAEQEILKSTTEIVEESPSTLETIAEKKEPETPSTTIEEKQDVETTQPDEHQAISVEENEIEVSKPISTEETHAPPPTADQTTIATEDDKSEEVEVASSVEEIKEETKPAISSEEQEQQVPSSTEAAPVSSVEEALDETKIEFTEEQQQIQATAQEEKELLSASSVDEQQVTSVTETETKVTLTEEQQIPAVSTEPTEDESKVVSTDEQQSTPVADTHKEEETKTTSVDEQTTETASPEHQEELKVALADEQQISSVTDKESSETIAASIEQAQAPVVSTEPTQDETKVVSIEEQQIPSTTSEEQPVVSTIETQDQEVKTVSAEPQEEEPKVVSSEEQQSLPSTEAEKKEQEQVPSVAEVQEAETKTTSTEEHQESSVTVSQKEDETTTTLPVDEQQTPSVAKEDTTEETTTASADQYLTAEVSSTETSQLSSTSVEEPIETTTVSQEEPQVASVSESEQEKTTDEQVEVPASSSAEGTPVTSQEQVVTSIEPSSDAPTSEQPQTTETKTDEEQVKEEPVVTETVSDNVEIAQQQADLQTVASSDVFAAEQTSISSIDTASSQKNRKHVTWDEAVVDNEDNDSSSHESITEESSTPEASITITPEESVAAETIKSEDKVTTELETSVDQQATSTDIVEVSTATSSTIADQQLVPTESADLQSTVAEVSSTEDQISLQTAASELIQQLDAVEQQLSSIDSIEQQANPSSPIETSSTVSDSTSEEMMVADTTESQVNVNEQQNQVTSSQDTQSLSNTDSSKEDTLTLDEMSTTISDMTSSEDISKAEDTLDTTVVEPNEEIATTELNKLEATEQVTELVPEEVDSTVIESATVSMQSTVVSPIDTLSDNVANRYISSDVYHGCLGEHKEFPNVTLDIDHETSSKSVFDSLRQTIIAPLIETIQSVVSDIQTKSTVGDEPKVESEVAEHSKDDTGLSATLVTESIEKSTDDKSQAEETQPLGDHADALKAAFETLREAAIAPITAITETIQASISSMKSENEEVSSSFTAEQSTIEKESSEDEKKQSDSIEEVKLATSLSFDSIQEGISKTVTKVTDTIQNVVSTITSATDMHSEGEQSAQQEKPESQSVSDSISTDIVSHQTSETRTEQPDSVVTDTIVSTSSDISNDTAELVDTSKQIQETVLPESLTAECLGSTLTIEKVEEPASEHVEQISEIQQEEPVSTSTSVTLEQADTSDQQEVAKPEVSEIKPTDYDESVSSSISVPTEQVDATIKQITTENEIVTLDKPVEASIEHDFSSSTSTESKTTLETIRDVITHPLTAITETIQNVISTSTNDQSQQAPIDTIVSSSSTSKEVEPSTEQQVAQTENLAVSEQQIESSQTKSTLENIQEFVTHPVTTITEKIQHIFSSSSTEEVITMEQQASQMAIDHNKHEDTLSAAIESSFEMTPDTITKSSSTVNETAEDVVLSSTDQTSLNEEKEQISISQQFKSDEPDQIQGEHQPSATTVTYQVSDNQTVIEKDESHIEHFPEHQKEDITSQEITSDTNNLVTSTVHNLIDDILSKVIYKISESSQNNEQLTQETTSSESGPTSQITAINVEDQSESSQSALSQPTITNEENILDNVLSSPEFTWTNLVGEKSTDETVDQSVEKMKQLLEEIIQSSDNILTVETTENKTIITLPDQTQSIISQQTIIQPQIDESVQQSTVDVEAKSLSENTPVENLPSKQLTDIRDSSPGNTEDDSFELMRTLQGHSIVHTTSMLSQPQTNLTDQSSLTAVTPEKADKQFSPGLERSSSSTTTSSQITNSDRYVSYAIHEMGDSSQERLPSFPIAADMPVYESVKTTSDENKGEQILSVPNANVNQNISKDDDLTELDATENLTYSDEILIQKLNASMPSKEKTLDASSTDEDVDDENFNEMETNDVSNLYRIMDEITQKNENEAQKFEQTYRRYDVSNSSSTSTKPTTDDVYIIPGYSGLWKPSADDDESRQSAHDADDEDENKNLTRTVKTRTIVRTTDPSKLQSFLQQHQEITGQDTPVRTETYDIFNRPLNEFSFDLSESDSFKTCASTISSSVTSKTQKQSELFATPIAEESERAQSPDEKIILIRERERGVSLPVTVKLQYDDLALRPSASTPIDASLYSTDQTDQPPSPTMFNETMEKTSSRESTASISSNESEKQKPPSQSWLNTTNTITTTTEGPNGPLESRTTIQKSAKGPISIGECDAQGKFITIENTSRSKSMVLSGWTVRQQAENGETLKFSFPENCLLRPNNSIKIYTKPYESERKSTDLIASSLSSWHTGLNFVTTLINAEGKDRASLTKKTIFS